MSDNKKNGEKAVVSSGIVEDDPHAKAGHRGFQSKEAMQAATQPVVSDEEPPEIPPLAECADLQEERRPPAQRMNEDPMRLVRVRSREYVPPFRYGPKMYTLPAGKDVLLPLAVKRHLEEKNLL